MLVLNHVDTMQVADDSFDADFGAFGQGESVLWKEAGGHEGEVGGSGLYSDKIVKGGMYWYLDGRDGQEKQVFVVLPHFLELTQSRNPDR